jgi:23S rRNA pseudouridine1911/1915/1917 synthase
VRLDLLVSRKFALSRRRAREFVETGRVDLAGATVREPGLPVEADADVRLVASRPPVGKVRTNLRVLHEDPDVLVVDKPAGLLSVPAEARERDTLLSRANAYLLHRYRRRPYVGVVHRLDKETSGALVFARSRAALKGLQELFRRHDVEREYAALVEGAPAADSGTIADALVADRGDRRRGVARRGQAGRKAVTRYRVVERFPRAALLSLQLETGRTHQIRVHLASIGHPVLGDAVYRPRGFGEPPLAVARQMLHARTLGFRHPGTGSIVRVESPLPEDFREAVSRLRRRASRVQSRR